MNNQSLFLEKVKRFFLYNGLSKEDYRAIAPKIIESNRILLAVFSALVSVIMIALLCFSGAADNLKENSILYIVMASLSALLFLLSLTACRVSGIVNRVCVYLFSAMILAYGIALGCFLQPDTITVSFVVLLFAFPLVFTLHSLEANILSIAALVVYFIFAKLNQPATIFANNLTVVPPYGVASLAVAHVVNVAKTARFAYERKAQILAERDALTGLGNRTLYERTLAEIKEKETTVIIAAIDINGLKKANDFLGHNAGDELIVGAASVLQSVFGSYGQCFRTGGDEFIVIIENIPLDPSELRKLLEEKVSSWRGSFNGSLSLAAGIVSGVNSKEIHAGLLAADKAMYQEKNAHYEKLGCRKK